MQTKTFSIPTPASHSSDFPGTLIGTDPSNDLRNLYNNLKISETRLELAAEAADAGLWSLDLDTYLFWANEKTLDMFNFPKVGEISFEDFTNRVHPDDIPLIQTTLHRVLQEGTKFTIEYRLLSPDRQESWVHSRGALFRNTKEGSSCIMGISIDITASKMKELAIARQLQFETLLSELSASFSRLLMPDTLDDQIGQALAKILNFIGGDRCAFIKLDLENRKSLIINACYREGFEPVPPDLDLVSLFPWSFNLLKEGRWHCFSALDDLPPEAAIDRSSYEAMGVTSSLRVPIPIENKVSYLLIINSLTDRISWPLETLPRLQMFGGVFASAIYRKEVEAELRKSCNEIAVLKEKLEVEADFLRAEVRASTVHDKIIGQSEKLREVLTMVEQVAPTNSTTLVCGETGTGKELIAQAIHNLSPRRSRLMVKVNCASLPSSLVESELFGRERGAYTGALTRQVGRFEHADGSTLFLDEISELSLELQSKLLRVLQEGEFERLGSPKTVKVDVRIIAATNRNLLEEVKAGRFRDDLYYRLSVFPIYVPPLRERQQDIPMLVWEFVREFSEKMGKKVNKVPKKEMASLLEYGWPGNIRELRNVIEYGVIVCTDEALRVRLPGSDTADALSGITLEVMESRYIEDVLRKTGWRIKGDNGAARVLGLNPATLYSKMKKLGISLRREKEDI